MNDICKAKTKYKGNCNNACFIYHLEIDFIIVVFFKGDGSIGR